MTNAVPEPLNNDIWIPASQALARFEKYTKDRKSAKESLAELLRDGLLASYATQVWEVKTNNVHGLWDDGSNREDLNAGIEIPVETWRDSERWRKDCDDWRWPYGNFCVTFQRKPTFMRALHRVSFSRMDLDKIIDDRAPSKGGRPPKLIEKTAFWHAMISLERQGRLKTFQTRASLSEAVLEEINDCLSIGCVKTDVSQVFQKFCTDTQRPAGS